MLTTASEPLIGRISRSLTFNRHTWHFTSGNRQLMPIDIPCQSWQIGLGTGFARPAAQQRLDGSLEDCYCC